MSADLILEKDRKLLLQLTGGNPAINYKEFRAKGLLIADAEIPDLLFNLLDKKEIRFASKFGMAEAELDEGTVEDQQIGSQPEEDDATPTKPQYTTKQSIIYYNGEHSTMLRRLLKTSAEAKLAEEEQGVNILFLALGHLSWKEDEKAEKAWRSPLLLIPVKLTKTGTGYTEKWTVAYSEEEIEPNHSLIVALKQYHNIDFPATPDFDELASLEEVRRVWTDWIQRIQEIIQQRKGWQIDERFALLSFFSFAKYQMYQDLTPEKWQSSLKNVDGSIIRSLLQDGFKSDAPALDDNYNFDVELPADQPLTVLDMDSSQATVLLEAARAKCLIVEGPPGTGKSQTITNLIAAAVAEGKKVLFVAEKMAALEVVKRNLTKVGLGAACLELHGAKARKTVFLETLKEVLHNVVKAKEDSSFSTETINKQKDELRKWSGLMMSPVRASGYTPYELFGLLLWSKSKLGGILIPNLETLIADTGTFKKYAEGVSKTSVGNHRYNGPELEEIAQFQMTLNDVGDPATHPFRDVQLKSIPLDSAREAIHLSVARTIESLQKLQTAFTEIRNEFPELPLSKSGVERFLQFFQSIEPLPHPRLFKLLDRPWLAQQAAIGRMLDAGEKITAIQSNYSSVLLPTAWSADVNEARTALATIADNFFTRLFNKRLKTAKRQITSLFANPAEAKGQKLLDFANAIIDHSINQKQVEGEANGAALFGELWQGLDSDWAALRRDAAWLAGYQNDLKSGKTSATFASWLLLQESIDGAMSRKSAIQDAFRNAQTALKDLFGKLELDWDAIHVLNNAEFSIVLRRLEEMAISLPTLTAWIQFSNSAASLRGSGKGWVVDVAAKWPESKTLLVDYCRNKLWESLLERAMADNPALSQTTRVQLDATKNSFSANDVKLQDYYKRELINKHAGAITSFGNLGQAQFVRSNLNRKRNIPSIRKFMTASFDAIASIKPIFMMSPLSVAGYLAAQPDMFDLVVFDEASQIEPVDAYGAILRAKRVVVVGDTKQMPPTGFFKKMLSEEVEEEEDTLVKDIDSIMELMIARGARSKSLRWHYRSRHESLISVSNKHFYTPPGLLVFPSAFSDHNFLGLKLEKQDCAMAPYEGKGTNSGEAKAVALAVLRFANEHPNKTLGVVAFNINQREAIDKEVQQLSRQNSALASFIGKGGIEPFFIKNLENVQGDERDVIFISIGYGKTANGTISYIFGALNRDGGERRLNVLITRARLQCKVFSNFASEDVDENRVKHQGVKILKHFLYYAEHGKELYHEPTDLGADSIFEEQVLAAVEAMGYQADLQVGSKGYRIDLAIKHPEKPGRYVLAVECDGATYHSAQSARDRDRLRQSVLEGLGWRFYRIWSSNWFYYQDQEKERLKAAIEAAIQFADSQSDSNSAPAAQQQLAPPEIELEELPAVATEVTTMPASDFHPYEMVDTSQWVKSSSVLNIPLAVLERYLLEIIQTESPVHSNRLFSRITAFQDSKLGSRIRQHLEEQLSKITRTGKAKRQGEFIWASLNLDAHKLPRNHASVPDRELNLIAPEELDAAFIQLTKKAFSIGEDELILAASRNFGFQRCTSGMQVLMKGHLTTMIQKGKLVRDGEHAATIKMP